MKKEVDEATAKAKQDTEIGLDELTADICVQFLEPNIRNVTPYAPLSHKRIGPAVNKE